MGEYTASDHRPARRRGPDKSILNPIKPLCVLSLMPSKPLDVPMQVAKAFARDMRAYHVERDAVKRAEIAQRQLDALQRFQGPRDKRLRFRDITKLFEEMKDHA